ncbi:MAG: rod shape-determining protein MreC [Phycisphaerae bacterium]|jgi:cell shape-determining protein MreC
MARKQFKPSKLTLFIGLILLGCIFLLLPQSATSRVNFAFIDIFGYFLNMGSPAAYKHLPKSSSPDFVSRHEYNRLWVAYSNMQTALYEQKRQMEELGKVRLTEPDPSTGLVLAKIVSRKEHEFIIDRGSNDGLKVGQYVLGDNAVIGLVEQVSTEISSIRLITSSACKLPIKISAPEINTYFNGTMQGDDKKCAMILNIPQKYEVNAGFNVYAAEKTGFLRSMRIIGRISKCAAGEKNPVVWDITVEPAYNLNNITDVAVIVLKVPE